MDMVARIPSEQELFAELVPAVSLAADLTNLGTDREESLCTIKGNLTYNGEKLDGMYSNGSGIVLDSALDEVYGYGAKIGTYAHEKMHQLFDGILTSLGCEIGSEEVEEWIEQKTGKVLRSLKKYATGKVRELAEYGLDFWYARQGMIPAYAGISGQAAAGAGTGAGAGAAAAPKWYKTPLTWTWKVPFYAIEKAAYFPLTFVSNLLSMGAGAKEGFDFGKDLNNGLKKLDEYLASLI